MCRLEVRPAGQQFKAQVSGNTLVWCWQGPDGELVDPCCVPADQCPQRLPFGEGMRLESVVASMKGRAARAVNRALNRKGYVWMPGFDGKGPDKANVDILKELRSNPV